MGGRRIPRERPVIVPVFAAGLRAAIDMVPQHVAREALRIVAELAAGEPSAWRAMKRSKRRRVAMLMTRIGIHYRLLCRTDDASLEAIDLVSREGLMLALEWS